MSSESEDYISDDEVSQISKESKKNQLSAEFKEKVVSYIKIDDLIKKRNDEIKELKEKKKPCEEFIITFLDKMEAEFVNVQGGKLVKNQVESKAPLKEDIIKEAIFEELKNNNLVKDEEKANKLLEDILVLLDRKRERKVKVNIKRVMEREKKKKKEKSKAK